MKVSKQLLPMFLAAYAFPVASEPVSVSLPEYAFNFPVYGYEIIVSGTTGGIGKLSTEDSIYISDDGYRIRSRWDGLGRRGRQEFLGSGPIDFVLNV